MTAAPQGRRLARLHLSETAYGSSPRVRAALERETERLHVYPDASHQTIEAALAAFYAVPESSVLAGNGSDELVLLSALALVGADERALVTDGTFPGYRICLERAGKRYVSVPLDGRRVDVAAAAAAFPGTRTAYFCNPHNPSGAALSRTELNVLVEAAAASATVLVFDEAYAEFADRDTASAIDAVRAGRDVVVLRTFSKAYGLAALRIGYALGRAETIAKLRAAQGSVPFSVNRFAQAAAVAALSDTDFIPEVNRANRAMRDWFSAELRRRGRTVLDSQTNFVAVLVDEPARVERELLEHHAVLVRDAGRFGFAGCIRVSVGARGDLTSFLEALDRVDAPRAELV